MRIIRKLVTLQQWADRNYAGAPPHIKTLRRWCREGKIYPAPQKQGRTYYLVESARYVGDYNSPEFMGSLGDTA